MPSVAYVTLSRTGRCFAVEQGEVILAAALRQEIWLPHACCSGTCGSCKAIILAGAVTYDDVARAGAKQAARQNEALLCCAKASGDVTLDVSELAVRPSHATRRVPARVVEVRRGSPNVMVVTLKPPPTEVVQFRPGQHISLVGNDGRLHPFSIANAPRADRTLELHIGRIPHGRFTGYVHEQLQPRDVLRFEGPFGLFGLSDATERPAILLAGGTGIAPIKAMLEAAGEEGARREFHLYWGNRRKEGFYAIEALSASAAALGARVTIVLSEPAQLNAWPGRVGPVHRAVIEDFPDLSRFDVYACGSPGLVDTAFRTFTSVAALPPDRFFADAFHRAAPAMTDAAE
jgi:CDP-4-dehydro-6-deoxyglucose reductase, E3